MRRAWVPLGRAALVALILYLLLRNIGIGRLSAHLRGADWKLVALAAFLNLALNSPGRIMKFSILLRSLSAAAGRISMRDLTELIFATRTLNMVLPARFGEAYRLARLRRKHGYPMASVATALLLETLIEIIAMCSVAPIALLSLGSSMRYRLAIAFGMALLGALAVPLIRRLTPSELAGGGASRPPSKGSQPRARPPSRISQARARALQALHQLSAPRTWIAVLCWTWFADFIDLLTIGLCLNAVQLKLAFPSWVVVLLGVNLAILLPVVPGNVGTFEAGAVLALATLGVSQGPALAFAVLYHAVQVLPIAAVGAVCLKIGEKPERTRIEALRGAGSRTRSIL